MTTNMTSVPTLRIGSVPTRRSFQGIPGIEVTADAVWTTWYGGGDDEGTGNYVLVARSEHDAHGNEPRWHEPFMWIEPDDHSRIFDSVLWLDPDGRLWLFFTQTSRPGSNWDGRGGVWATSCEDPVEGYETWSTPRRLGDGVMMNKPTVARSGEWLLPIGIWDHPPFHDGQVGRRFPYAARTADSVRTVTYGHGAPMPPRTFDEHVILERADGTLKMYARSSPTMLESESVDGGVSWSSGRAGDIPCADSRFALRTLESGRWLLITNWMPEGDVPHPGEWGQRSYLSARLSSDEGATWSSPLMLHRDPVVSYPDFTERDGWIWAVWDRNRYAEAEILVSRFTETDVLEGSLGSAGSFVNAVSASLSKPTPTPTPE